MIYLDYNATTPIDNRVADAMQPFLRSHFGNPSSGHALGREARQAIDGARQQVADLLQADPEEIIFTSGGTESNNHALIGGALLAQSRGRHLLISAVEHPAVTEVCRHLETRGFSYSQVPVDGEGRLSLEAVKQCVLPETTLISIMLANNEVGTLQPIAEVAAWAREQGILVHTDCAQAVGKIPVSFRQLGVDMLSVAGHKLYGPKGIGVLCVRSGLKLPNLMYGAGHEKGRRPGTENILEIVGLGEAARLAREDVAHEVPRLAALRDRFQDELLEAFPEARVNGHRELRLPNTLSLSFPDLMAEEIMAAMPDILVSAGAACHGGGPVASQVLQAMKVPDRWALGTLRISLGRLTSEEDVTKGIAGIREAIQIVKQRKDLPRP